MDAWKRCAWRGGTSAAHRPRARRRWAAPLVVGLWLLPLAAPGEVRVQDVARLQGQRTNKLFGFGLVVGLDGTGDGAKSPSTMRALMQLHKNYHQPVLKIEELKDNNNVAIVAVEAVIGEFGAREGQTIDVTVSAIGTAKSLAGGQLLTTPLQAALLSAPDVFALAGGRIELADPKNLKRGTIRSGATLEDDFFYNFIEEGGITLVLDDAKAGFGWAQAIARGINQQLSSPAVAAMQERGQSARTITLQDFAVAISPREVRVEIPAEELDRPASFVSRVLDAKIFEAPRQGARVVINRTKKSISMSGTVTVAPTILQINGLGAISVGGATRPGAGGPPFVGLDPEKAGKTEFQELLNTLNTLQLSPEQMIEAVEQLHRTGTLHAQLVYAE